jgi:hypothetical protein
MQIIEERSGQHNLGRRKYGPEDYEFFLEALAGNVVVAMALTRYLEKNEQTIEAVDCYDSQSGWNGTHYYLEGTDLSKNGYCFNSYNVEHFLYSKSKIQPKSENEKLMDHLKSSVNFMEEHQEDMDEASWSSQDGVIITGNEAKYLIGVLEKIEESR